MTESEARLYLESARNAYSKRSMCVALEVAINALEKQIPKKPVEDKFHHMCCPNCGYTLLIHRDSEPDLYVPYCENCGQKILWQNVPFAYKDNFEELEELTDEYLEEVSKQ